MFLQKTMPGWLAVLLRDNRLQCAYVERVGRQATLKWLRSMEFEDGPAKALSVLRKSLRNQRYRCSTVIPYGKYQTFEVPAPKVDPSEWRDALRWVVKDHLEFPVEEALIETMAVPNEQAPPGRDPMLYVIAAPRNVVAQQMRWFESARLPLKVISIGNLAQRNVAAMFESPGRGLAFLGFYPKATLMTFTCDASIYASRHFVCELALLHDDAEPNAHRETCERVVLNVQRALDGFDSQFSYISLERVLVCVLPGHTKLVALLKRSLSQRVEEVDLRQVMDVSACPELDLPSEQTRWIHAIGMGLRVEGEL